jgi:predicted dehydrogenase
MIDETTIGVGVVGLGMISRPHLEGYAAANGANLVAVCDIDAARARAEGERYGATAYSEFAKLLADPAVDAVALQLPHQLHHKLAKQALEAGKHVIVEKPLTTSEADADDLIRTAAEHGVRLAAAENTRFVTAYVELEKVIRAGTLGEIRMIRGFIPDQILHEWKDDALGWKREPFGGGAIIDCAPHMLYLLTWLLGETEVVQAFARGYVPEIALENHAVICGATTSGTLFAMEFCSVTEYPRGERVEVYGADGAIIIDQVLDPPVVFYRGDQDPKGTPLDVPYDLGGWKHNSIMAGCQDFVDAIRSGREPGVDLQHAKYTIRLIEAAYESIRRGGLAIDAGSPVHSSP